MTETITADKGMDHDMDTYINYGEAMEESERLKKVTGNSHVVVRERCDCDYHPMCGRCAGEGGFYEVVEQTVLSVEHSALKSCREMEIEESEAA
jgi:hypothetical protein